MGGGKKDSPDPPDYSGVAASSEYAAELAYLHAQDSLDWAKTRDAENQAVLKRVLDTMLPIQEDAAEQAKQDREYMIDTFRPLETQFIAEAQAYDTPERREQKAGEAMTDVALQFAQQRQANEARLQSYGIDPSQGQSQSLLSATGIEKAKASAFAGNQARTQVENTGRALRADAINLGKNLPSQVAASYGTSIQAGNSSVGNSTATTNAGANAMQPAAAFMGAGNSAVNTWGNTLNMGYQNQMSQWNANQAASGALMGGLGQLAGTAAGMYFRDGGSVGGTGLIRGKGDGSGIDDAIEMEVAPGTYILPKDTVQKVGRAKLDRAVSATGATGLPASGKVPIKVSSGEYRIAPGPASAIGRDKLDALVAKTHTPAAQQRKQRGKKK